MPRYFFNRSGTDYLADQEGDECPTLQAAGSRAVVGAKELIAELRSVQRRPVSLMRPGADSSRRSSFVSHNSHCRRRPFLPDVNRPAVAGVRLRSGIV